MFPQHSSKTVCFYSSKKLRKTVCFILALDSSRIIVTLDRHFIVKWQSSDCHLALILRICKGEGNAAKGIFKLVVKEMFNYGGSYLSLNLNQ